MATIPTDSNSPRVSIIVTNMTSSAPPPLSRTSGAPADPPNVWDKMPNLWDKMLEAEACEAEAKAMEAEAKAVEAAEAEKAIAECILRQALGQAEEQAVEEAMEQAVEHWMLQAEFLAVKAADIPAYVLESGAEFAVDVPAGTIQIADRAFFNPSFSQHRHGQGLGNWLTRIALPDSVTEIADQAFWGCTGLTQIALPAGLTNLGPEAFWGCTGLTQIALPDGVTEIAYQAFRECTGLTQIALPAGLTKIETSAFSRCRGLTGIVLPPGLTQIASWAFNECTGLTRIDLPASVTKIGDHAFYWCTGLTEVTLPRVIEIGTDAFRGCAGLTHVTAAFPSAAFDANQRLAFTHVTVPAGTTEIAESAFDGCTGLVDVSFEAAAGTLVAIHEGAFEGCTRLTNVARLRLRFWHHSTHALQPARVRAAVWALLLAAARAARAGRYVLLLPEMARAVLGHLRPHQLGFV